MQLRYSCGPQEDAYKILMMLAYVGFCMGKQGIRQIHAIAVWENYLRLLLVLLK